MTDSFPEWNLALGKPSLQSSTLWSYDPGLAVDADPESCSFTHRANEQRWWQVHLGEAVRIQSVAVTITPGTYQHFTIFVIGNEKVTFGCMEVLLMNRFRASGGEQGHVQAVLQVRWEVRVQEGHVLVQRR
jgi:hypothetical protein